MTSTQSDEALPRRCEDPRYREIFSRFKKVKAQRIDPTDRAVLLACYVPFYSLLKRFADQSRLMYNEQLLLTRGTAAAMYERRRLFDACSEVQQKKWFDGKSLCKPTLHTPKSYRICGRMLVCPFCWARMVVIPSFQRLQEVLTDGVLLRNNRHALRKQRRYKLLVATWTSKRGYDHSAEAVLQEAARFARELPKRLPEGAAGGVAVTHVVPGPRSWVVTQKVLMLYEAQQTTYEPIGASKYSWLSPPIMTPQLLKAVGAVCEFPRPLLRPPEGRYDLVQELLTQRSRFRLMATYGILRGSRKLPVTRIEHARRVSADPRGPASHSRPGKAAQSAPGRSKSLSTNQ